MRLESARHTMKGRLTIIVLGIALFATSIGAVQASAAVTATSPVTPLSQGPVNPFTNIPVSGSVRPSGATMNTNAAADQTFAGSMTVQDFAVQHGVLVAHVALNGTAGSQTINNVDATVSVVVTGTCQVLSLVLGPLSLNLLGLLVNLNQVTLTITAQQGPGLLLGNLVCNLVNLLNSPTGTVSISTLLNRLMTDLKMVLNSLTPGFAVQNNQLVATESYSGTVEATAPVTATAPMTGTTICPVLTLDIGALHIDLLGLVIDLSPVHLTITAQQGAGNLLGNLVCSIDNLLNTGGSLTTIAQDLSQLIAILELPVPLL